MSDLTLNADVKLNISTGSTKGIRKQLETDLTSNPIKVKLDVEGTSEATKKVKESVSKLRAEAAKLRFDGDFFKQQDSLLKNMGLDNAQMQAARTQLNQLQTKYNEFISAFNSGDAKQTTSTFKTLWGEFGKYTAATTNLREGVTALNRELQNSAHINNAANSLQNYFQKFKQGIQGNTSLMTQFQHIQSGISSGAYAGKAGWDQLTADIATFKRQCQEAGVETQTLKQKLSNLFNQHFATAAVMAGIAALRTVIRELWTNVKKIDSALTQLEIVTGATGAELKQFASDAAQVSKAIGTNIVEVAKATETYARLGYTLSEALELSKQTNIFSNVADTDVKSGTDAITSILKAYEYKASDAEKITDILIKVGQEWAVSASELGIALQSGGASMEAANNTLEQSVALIAAGNASIQNAAVVGTAMKTVSMRIRGATTAEMEEAGADMDGMAESVSKLRDEILALSGVDIQLDADTFKSTYDIILELSKVWDNMSDISQANVLEKLAGKRQGTVVQSIITNVKDLEGAYASATNAINTTAEANAIYLDSIEGKTNQLVSAFQSLSVNFLDSNAVKGVIDVVRVLTSALDSLISTFGTLPVIISGIGIGSLVKNFGKPNDGLKVPVWCKCAA